MSMRERTYQLALGGILGAAALAFMAIGSLIPFGTFAVPALASLSVLIINEELNWKVALMSYLTISVLSLVIIPDKEAAALFIGFIGYYPILKKVIESRVRKKWLLLVIKLAAFNAAVLATYYVMLHLLVLPAIREEFADYTFWLLLLILALGNLAFYFFDIVISRVGIIYREHWRKRFVK